jgi:hypothetical protein
MANYAQRHHPQVQARRAGKLALNDFRREQYIECLHKAGIACPKGATKVKAFKLIVSHGLDMSPWSWQNRI